MGHHPSPETATLQDIERRLLWLATAMIHHANRRPNASGVKVGGHQASSASLISVMTALWFGYIAAPDRVSVKPHAAPALHAINYLLGLLDVSYLPRLREYGGLQSYPSRTKDPDPVDYSTGSVGIGATATIWGALAHRYVAGHFDVPAAGRQIALVGDAELDEGAVWEAIIDPAVRHLGEVLWIVDVNRQSLDRVVPEIATGRLATMFEAAGWHSQILKWGGRLARVFALEGGELLERRIARMPNAEYQRLLRCVHGELRDRLAGRGSDRRSITRFLGQFDDDELSELIRDLGGHDVSALIDAYRATDVEPDRPSVIFAYTIKAWRLPTEGHPSNHSTLLDDAQLDLLAERMGCDARDPWRMPAPDSAESRLCTETAARLRRDPPPLTSALEVPVDIGRRHIGHETTQQALGRLLVDLTQSAPEIAARIVTTSPDVASSTNLGGWINRTGLWSISERQDWFADDRDTLVNWRETERGQHIELGISEVNLVGLLGELGATWSRDGHALLPIGTLYDPFVSRALEPWSFGIYSGGQSILVGTPSGVTLAPEGGAHQSISTPSIGLEQPGCVAYEPAFGLDFEWTFLHAMSMLGRSGGSSAYFRLSTRPLDQSIARHPEDAAARELRRQAAIAGGYTIRRGGGIADVSLVGVGAVLPELVEAADTLERVSGFSVDVICLTSPDLVFRALQARQGLGHGSDVILDELFPGERRAPIVSVIDGHPHTLAFLGAVHAVPIACLGVTDFGQSGAVEDLYRHFGLDVDTIMGAAFDLVDAAT